MSGILLNALRITHLILSRTLRGLDAVLLLLSKIRQTVPALSCGVRSPGVRAACRMCRAWRGGCQSGDRSQVQVGASEGLGWTEVVRVLLLVRKKVPKLLG